MPRQVIENNETGLAVRTKINENFVETYDAVPAHVALSNPHNQYVLLATLAELIDDRVAALLLAGTNITFAYDDGANTLTIAAAGGSGLIQPQVLARGLGC